MSFVSSPVLSLDVPWLCCRCWQSLCFLFSMCMSSFTSWFWELVWFCLPGIMPLHAYYFRFYISMEKKKNRVNRNLSSASNTEMFVSSEPGAGLAANMRQMFQMQLTDTPGHERNPKQRLKHIHTYIYMAAGMCCCWAVSSVLPLAMQNDTERDGEKRQSFCSSNSRCIFSIAHHLLALISKLRY